MKTWNKKQRLLSWWIKLSTKINSLETSWSLLISLVWQSRTEVQSSLLRRIIHHCFNISETKELTISKLKTCLRTFKVGIKKLRILSNWNNIILTYNRSFTTCNARSITWWTTVHQKKIWRISRIISIIFIRKKQRWEKFLNLQLLRWLRMEWFYKLILNRYLKRLHRP